MGADTPRRPLCLGDRTQSCRERCANRDLAQSVTNSLPADIYHELVATGEGVARGDAGAQLRRYAMIQDTIAETQRLPKPARVRIAKIWTRCARGIQALLGPKTQN